MLVDKFLVCVCFQMNCVVLHCCVFKGELFSGTDLLGVFTVVSLIITKNHVIHCNYNNCVYVGVYIVLLLSSSEPSSTVTT